MSELSLIIPAFNGARFLVEAIDGARSQSRPPDEIIVVDDGSTDDTPGVAATLEGAITYIRRDRNGGPSAARNLGLARAGGALIAFMDVDDRIRPGRLAIQEQLLVETGSDAVWGRLQMDHLKGGVWSGVIDDPAFMPSVPSMMFTASCLARVGGFDESLRSGEDLDLLRRMQAMGMRIERHEDIVIDYLRHGSNMTEDPAVLRAGVFAAVRRAISERRGTP